MNIFQIAIRNRYQKDLPPVLSAFQILQSRLTLRRVTHSCKSEGLCSKSKDCNSTNARSRHSPLPLGALLSGPRISHSLAAMPNTSKLHPAAVHACGAISQHCPSLRTHIPPHLRTLECMRSEAPAPEPEFALAPLPQPISPTLYVMGKERIDSLTLRNRIYAFNIK